MILQSAIDYLANNSSVRMAHLIKIELPGTQEVYAYLTDFSSNIQYAGNVYQSGRVKGITSVRLTQGVQNYTLQVQVAGEFQDELNRGISDLSYEGRKLLVYRAYLDANNAIVPYDPVTNGPQLLFSGSITQISLNEDVTKGSSVISWECAGLLHDFEKVNGRLTDDTAHRGLTSDGISDVPVPSNGAKREAYKTDTGFLHANQTVAASITYLGKEKEYYLKKSWGGLKSKLKEREVEVQKQLDLKTSLEARFLPVVYGVRRVPGIPVFLDALSSDPSTMYCVYAVAEGEIESFLNLYIDGVPAVCTGGSEAESAGVCLGNALNGDTLSVYLDPSRAPDRNNQWQTYAYDRDGVAEDSNAHLNFPVASTTGTVHGCSFNIMAEKGTVWCKFYHGKGDQLACPELMSIASGNGFLLQNTLKKPDGSPWGPEYLDSNFRLLDTAYVVVKFKLSEDRTEIPNIEAVISGRIPTVPTGPTTFTKSYSLNPVHHLLDYLTNSTFGGGLDINTQIDLNSFKNVADYLNQIDTSYKLEYITWWRYIGWKTANSPRTVMQCNTVLNGEDPVTKNVEGLLSQFAGTLNVVGGRYVLSLERDNDPVASLNPSDILGAISVKNRVSKDKWNSIQASIIDPAMDWSTNQITFFNSTFLAEDNGIRKRGNAVFAQITNYYTARSWAERTLNTSRFSRSLTFTTYYKYQYLLPNDVVLFTHERFGYNEDKFRVTEVEVMQDGLVRLTIEKFDPAGYLNSPQPELGNPSGNGEVIPRPRNLTFSFLPNEDIPININGDTTVYGILYWDVETLVDLMRYEGDYRDNTGNVVRFESIDKVEVAGVPKYYTLIRNMEAQKDYIFRVQTLITSGLKSAYSIYEFTTGVSVAPSELPEVTDFRIVNIGAKENTFTGPDLNLSWTPRSELYLSGYDIVIKDPATSNIIYEALSIPTFANTHVFTLASNMAGYALLNSDAVGAYRSLETTIYTVSSGRRSNGVTL